jgi:hypothetical protein
MRAQRAELKSRRDHTRVAPGKRSAARGFGRKMISSLFSFSVSASSRRAETEKEKRQAVFVVLDPGRPSLRSVALGYHQAAPLGLRKGEPVVTADAGRPPICFQSLLAQRGCTQSLAHRMQLDV